MCGTDSPIIARFSSRLTFVTFSRCSAQVLPTRQTAGAKQSTSAQARVLLGGHVTAPGHPERDDRRLVQLLGVEQLEQLDVLRVGAREAGLDEWTPSASSAWTTRTFSAADRDMPWPCMPSRRVVS